jgi:uncharacterized membrane protein YqaE (UPF0057 family)
MCSSDIFLAVLAVFFPPIAGKHVRALATDPLHPVLIVKLYEHDR